MKQILTFLAVVTLTFSVTLYAGPMGPNVSKLDGKELKWENGAHDYFVMFKSSVTYQGDNLDMENPQANTCLNESTFELTNTHIPADAFVESAYLIWMNTSDTGGGVNNTIRNKVNLFFKNASTEETDSWDVTALSEGSAAGGPHNFSFEGVTTGTIPIGYYTYRADVTDIFTAIHEQGRESGLMNEGDAYYGDYTVSDMFCSADSDYRVMSMSGGWALVLIYKSEQVAPKKIYMYNGFSGFQYTNVDINVTDFTFPKDPRVKITLMVGEGDPKNVNAAEKIPEGLFLKGEGASQYAPIYDDCNPPMTESGFGGTLEYTEIYNSISSLIPWNSDTPICIGGVPGNYDIDNMEYGIDVDTFILESSDPKYAGQIAYGDESLTLQIGANADYVVTNFMVLSVDSRAPAYDIPDEREKDMCSCSGQPNSFCLESNFYYTIKVENWGGDVATNVRVSDALPPQVTYVPGTTEIASQFDSDGKGIDWTSIPDDKGGVFPLADSYLVAESMDPCTESGCPQTYLIRFLVKPDGQLSKKATIKNSAVISDDRGVKYKSNSDVPLRVVIDSTCPSADICSAPDKCSAACGGCETGGTEPTDNDENSDKSTEENSDTQAGVVEDDAGCGCSVVF